MNVAAAGHDPGEPAWLTAEVRQVDHTLSEIYENLDFLTHVSPVNADEAWAEFERSGFTESPALTYRPLAEPTHLLKRTLFAAPVEAVDDPALEALFREMQEELDVKITMLRDRDTERFRFGSLMVYGNVEDDLVETAKQLLYRLPQESGPHGRPQSEIVDCHAFVEMAQSELDHYRSLDDDFPCQVEVRDDVLAGIMVNGDCLVVNRDLRLSRNRALALIQHEIGTHLVTRFNGKCQPLRLFACGLAGYDPLQEGLAVAAEYLVGGLPPRRLRTLAGRVLAVQCLCAGASFCEAHEDLTGRYGFTPKGAFNIVVRVYRGGGLTKDAVYLRGLVDFLNHVGTGGALEPLLVGKVALAHVPMVQDLLERGLLEPAAVVPRFLVAEICSERMERLRSGISPLELLDPEN